MSIVVTRAPRELAILSSETPDGPTFIVLNDSGVVLREYDKPEGAGIVEFEYAPDGSALLYSTVSSSTAGRFGEIFRLADDGTQVLVETGIGDPTVPGNRGVEFGFEWSPDSSELAYLYSSPDSTGLDVVTINPDGTARSVVNPESRPELPRSVFVSAQYTSGGDYLVMSGQTTETVFFVQPRDGSGTPAEIMTAASSGVLFDTDINVSESSARFCYMTAEGTALATRQYLQIADASRPNAAPVEVSANARFPNVICNWLPDTDAFVWFEEAIDGSISLMRQDASDFSAATQFSDLPSGIQGVTLKAIGGENERVLFEAQIAGVIGTRIFVTENGGTPVQVDMRRTGSSDIAPDAEKMAYFSFNDDGTQNLNVYTFDTAERVTVDLGISGNERIARIYDWEWSDDGDKLVASIRIEDGADVISRLVAWDMRTGSPQVLLERQGTVRLNPRYRPRQ